MRRMKDPSLVYAAMVPALMMTAYIGADALDGTESHKFKEAERPQVVVEAFVEKEPEASIIQAIPLSAELQEVLISACDTYDVGLPIALAVIEGESGFDPDAVGIDGKDFGLFQIRQSNHAWLEGETGEDPMTYEGNIECGVWLLSYLDGRYETTSEALTAYRWGHDNGDRTYANAVLERAEAWEDKLNG